MASEKLKIAGKVKDNNWRIWDRATGYSDILYRRATGELPEMESAKSLCRIIKPLYTKGMRVLDVGCGAGHYLRSLRERVDREIDYTGTDATKSLIYLAKRAFGDRKQFLVADIRDLKDFRGKFDIVMCNNVILHLPPPPDRALRELIRSAKKYAVIRTVFGVRNYIIKEVRTQDEGVKKSRMKKSRLFDDRGAPLYYNYFNIYTEEFNKELVKRIDKRLKVQIIPDNDWGNFDNSKIAGKEATRVIGGSQIAGNLILDWRFIIIKK